MEIMTEMMRQIIECMQEAVDLEMERKAKLGYTAIVGDKDGNPIEVPAKLLVRRRRAQKKRAMQKKIARSENL